MTSKSRLTSARRRLDHPALERCRYRRIAGSGGYAGAKRTQLFIANYAQKESDRLGLGLPFAALAPRITPDTDLGKHAVAGYSRYLGISAADFISSMVSPPTSSDVASAVIEPAADPDQSNGKVIVVSGQGLEAVTL